MKISPPLFLVSVNEIFSEGEGAAPSFLSLKKSLPLSPSLLQQVFFVAGDWNSDQRG